MGIVDLLSVNNKPEQQFLVLPAKTYQPFHLSSPPEFTEQFIQESRTLTSTMKAVIFRPK